MFLKAVNRCLSNAELKGLDKTYWAMDIQGTVLRPTYKKGTISMKFYPFAKDALLMLTKNPKVCLILYTCSYKDEVVQYLKFFKRKGIQFDYVNENPEINAGAYGYYDKKFYFNLLLDDKAGFDPERDWANVNRVMARLSVISDQ